MPKQKTVRKNKELDKEVKTYTSRGLTVKEALVLINGKRMKENRV